MKFPDKEKFRGAMKLKDGSYQSKRIKAVNKDEAESKMEATLHERDDVIETRVANSIRKDGSLGTRGDGKFPAP